eukprot:1766401-Rhodomonas_salina.2
MQLNKRLLKHSGPHSAQGLTVWHVLIGGHINWRGRHDRNLPWHWCYLPKKLPSLSDKAHDGPDANEPDKYDDAGQQCDGPHRNQGS